MRTLLLLPIALVACGPPAPAERQPLPDPLIGVEAQELYDRGIAAARNGDHVRAEQYLVAAVDRGYDEDEVMPLLLRSCVASNRLSAALRYAHPYLRDHPEDWSLRYLVATIHLGLGESDTAHRELLQVIEDAPEEPAAYYALGMLLREENGDSGEARPYLERYLALAPEGRHAAEVRSLLRRDDHVPIQRVIQAPAPEAETPPEGGAG